MILPPDTLGDVISQVLTLLEMEYGEDYLLVMEEPIRGVGDRYSPYIEKEILATRQYNWIGSVLDFNVCFVWLCTQDIDFIDRHGTLEEGLSQRT